MKHNRQVKSINLRNAAFTVNQENIRDDTNHELIWRSSVHQKLILLLLRDQSKEAMILKISLSFVGKSELDLSIQDMVFLIEHFIPLQNNNFLLFLITLCHIVEQIHVEFLQSRCSITAQMAPIIIKTSVFYVDNFTQLWIAKCLLRVKICTLCAFELIQASSFQLCSRQIFAYI